MRLVMFAAMAALLVAAMCVPGAFGGEALLFAIAYGVVRAAHIALFMLASRDDAALRRSVIGLAVSTAIGVGLLVAAAFAPSAAAASACGAWRCCSTWAGPCLFGAEGWKLVAGALRRAPRRDHHHRARRVDRRDRRRRDARTSTRASSRRRCSASSSRRRSGGCTSTSSRSSPRRRLVKATRGARAERDGARLLLAPALADGRRDRARRGGPEEDARPRRRAARASLPPRRCSAAPRTYLLAHVAFRLAQPPHGSTASASSARVARCVAWWAEVVAKPPSLLTVGVLAAVLSALIAYEALHFAAARDRVRHEVARDSL